MSEKAAARLFDASLDETKCVRLNTIVIIATRILESSMALVIATIVLFWQRAGLNMAEILWLQAIFALALAILEVPSGYVADLFGRKRVIVLGLFAMCLGDLVYSISTNFLEFVFAELLLAFGLSMVSGADEALLYDTLATEGRELEFGRIWGRAISFGFYSAAFWSVAGGYLGAYNLRFPFIASGLILGVGAFLSLALKEPERAKLSVSNKGHLKDFLSVITYCVTENKVLAWLIAYSAVLLGINQVSVWFYQPYFVLCGIDAVYFGWLFAGMQIVAGVSSKYSSWLEKRMGIFYSCALSLAILSISFVLLGNVVYWWSFVFIAAHQFVRGFLTVVHSDYVNRSTVSQIRATTASIRSFAVRGLYIVALILTSSFADDGPSLLGVWSVLASMLFVGGGGMLLLRPK